QGLLPLLHRRALWASLFLVTLTLAAHGGACDCDFVNFDDDSYVTANPNVQAGLTGASLKWAFTTTEMVNWNPLTWVSFQADHQLYGLNPAGFHWTNVALHALDT